MPCLSVIIPVYNVEKYLKKCVENILSQTFNDAEILLIDDGSTDSSGVFCDDIALIDNRVQVFHKLNGGLSSARNYGMDKASGKYIIFLDSDDYWIGNNVISLLVDKIEKENLDVVRGEYVNVDNNGNLLYTPNNEQEGVKLKARTFSSYEMMRYVINNYFFSWLFIFRKSAINNCRFDENRKFQEDIDFAIKVFSRNLRCGYLPIQFYAYRQRENSIISTPRISNLEGSFTLCDVFYEYAHKVEDKRLTNYYIYRAVMMYYWTLETVASDLYIHQYKEIESNLSLISLRKKVYNWTKQISQYRFPIHIYVPPYIGVYLFRLRWWGGQILRTLKLRQ